MRHSRAKELSYVLNQYDNKALPLTCVCTVHCTVHTHTKERCTVHTQLALRGEISSFHPFHHLSEYLENLLLWIHLLLICVIHIKLPGHSRTIVWNFLGFGWKARRIDCVRKIGPFHVIFACSFNLIVDSIHIFTILLSS